MTASYAAGADHRVNPVKFSTEEGPIEVLGSTPGGRPNPNLTTLPVIRGGVDRGVAALDLFPTYVERLDDRATAAKERCVDAIQRPSSRWGLLMRNLSLGLSDGGSQISRRTAATATIPKLFCD